jgi:hypothetical protein
LLTSSAMKILNVKSCKHPPVQWRQAIIVTAIVTRIIRQVEGKPTHVANPQMLFINVG